MTTTENIRDRISAECVRGQVGTYDVMVDGEIAVTVTGAANLAAVLRRVRDELIRAA